MRSRTMGLKGNGRESVCVRSDEVESTYTAFERKRSSRFESRIGRGRMYRTDFDENTHETNKAKYTEHERPPVFLNIKRVRAWRQSNGEFSKPESVE